MIHSEIVLQGDCRIGLGHFAHFDIFLRFECLVESIGIATAFHHTAGLLVHDFDLTFHDHVFLVALKKRVCL